MEYKRGTLFELTGVLKNYATGLPVSLAGCTVESQLRHFIAGKPATLIADLVGEVLPGENGVYRITFDQADTLDWPLVKACVDVVFVRPLGERVVTKGFIAVNIIDPSTQEPIIGP